ncbi:hypothetical protein PPERSA_07274 [Pseudocohnilembus persalinus]|uniref:Uncharacterized protein n=1 Tax=Pseudocohnilembus persalinus TaxID=266149 RepID=A0A0V0QCY0_PSEPJ|nr:hypothetical protein PPERSA_07274 [Pseudocohnilembus persalinus]|eukprot:KRX00077.1 hypothetical protein PPERSA_07274 [Pseudocohnilembus persalinus]
MKFELCLENKRDFKRKNFVGNYFLVWPINFLFSGGAKIYIKKKLDYQLYSKDQLRKISLVQKFDIICQSLQDFCCNYLKIYNDIKICFTNKKKGIFLKQYVYESVSIIFNESLI